MYTEHGRPQVKRSEILTRTSSEFLWLWLHLDQGRVSLPISKARELIAHACRISSQKMLSYTELDRSVPIHGITQLGLRSHPTGRLYLRPLQRHFHSLGQFKKQFTPPCRSDPSVLATLLRQWQDLSFLMSENPV